MTGVNMVHVPYRGAAPALTDLLAGQVHVYFSPMAVAIGYVRSGVLPALAVTTASRLPALPDTPTLADFVPGYEATNWYGIVVPHNTPADIATSSTRRSTRAWPIRRSTAGSSTWEVRCWRSPPPS